MADNTSAVKDNRPTEKAAEAPQPIASLRFYRRLAYGRKALFAPSDTAAADYFIVNPVPQKHSKTWKPVFYRGDNPKYTPSSTVIGRAFRNGLWRTFDLQLGEGVGEVLENERKKSEASKLKVKNKFRKTFGAQEKAPTEDLEQQEVVGKVLSIPVKRVGFSRKVEFEIGGVQYQWKGTRMYSTSFMKGVKGWSHSFKLVRKHDNALIAGVDKRRWASYSSSIKSDGPPNKSKEWTGTLYFYDASSVTTGLDHTGHNMIPEIRIVDEEVATPSVNQTNELTDAIPITCWMVVEAERRMRMFVLDVLQTIGENAGG